MIGFVDNVGDFGLCWWVMAWFSRDEGDGGKTVAKGIAMRCGNETRATR